MQVRTFGVTGAVLVAFSAVVSAASCGGQSGDQQSSDAANTDAQILDASFDSESRDGNANSDADVDANTCPPHEVECSGVCTDTRFDPHACGSCANSCGPGEVCTSGVCASTCPSTQAACKDEDGGLRCADALTDNENCGYCGNVCDVGKICSNGQCVLTCGAGDTKCVAGDGTPFCTNLQSDPDDCNACGNACPLGSNVAAAFCSAGQCGITCVNGSVDCNSNSADGCEAYPASDVHNCGGCGNNCPVGAYCSSGSCTCYTIYGGTAAACNGACVNVQRDPTNCGSCGVRCTSADPNVSADCVASACHSSNRAVATTTTVSSIALDDTYLYFVRQGTGIQRVTKASTGETPVALIADTTAYGIAITGGTIFWTNSHGVFKCPVTGCVGSAKAVSDVPSTNSRIVLDDTNFYWTLGSSGVNGCAQTGCQDAPVLMTNQYVTSMATSSSALFIALQYSPYYLESIQIGDPPTTTLVNMSSNPGSGLAYHGGQLYWDAGLNLDTCNAAACIPKIVTPLPSSYTIGAIVADDAAVFWVADGIHETNLATSADAVIANIKSGATQLALDPADVYWAGSDGVYWAPR